MCIRDRNKLTDFCASAVPTVSMATVIGANVIGLESTLVGGGFRSMAIEEVVTNNVQIKPNKIAFILSSKMY